jgi:cell wall-associated NlpC family hydrolase
MSRLIVLLLASVATACASTGATPRPFPSPSSPPAGAPPAGSPTEPVAEAPPAAPPSQDTYAITGTALSLRGVPYRNGGSDPAGFDCSGFVWYVFGQHGVVLPRTVTEQFRMGIRVDPIDLRPGDLVFFDTTGSGRQASQPTHIGISIGGDEFVHAPSTAGQVRVERLVSSYWAPRFLEARRVQ